MLAWSAQGVHEVKAPIKPVAPVKKIRLGSVKQRGRLGESPSILSLFLVYLSPCPLVPLSPCPLSPTPSAQELPSGQIVESRQLQHSNTVMLSIVAAEPD